MRRLHQAEAQLMPRSICERVVMRMDGCSLCVAHAVCVKPSTGVSSSSSSSMSSVEFVEFSCDRPHQSHSLVRACVCITDSLVRESVCVYAQ